MNSNINDCDNIIIIIIVRRLTLQVSAPCCVRLNNIYIILLLTRFYPAAAIVNRNRSRKLELFQNISTKYSKSNSQSCAGHAVYLL